MLMWSKNPLQRFNDKNNATPWLYFDVMSTYASVHRQFLWWHKVKKATGFLQSAKEIIQKIEILTDVLDFYFLKWEN